MLRLSALVALAVVVHGIPQPKKCGIDGYNPKPLRKGENDEPYKASSPKGHYEYFFNFCGHAKGCYQQPTCQVRIREDGKEEIATVTTTGELYTMLWEKIEPKEFAAMKSKGLGDFKDGLKVGYQIGPMQRSTTIYVPCIEEGSDVEEAKIVGYVTEDPILHYSMVMPSRHGCPVPVSQMPINIGSGGTSKSSLFGMFLIMGLLVYCCAGAWYKRERLGAQGIEMIPHIDSMCAMVECTKGMFAAEAGGMFNRAGQQFGDDGL